MANTKIIKNKIKAITSIKKITKTMEMVAVSKMKKSVTNVTDIREYIEEIKFVINKIKSESQEDHILFNNQIPQGRSLRSENELVIIFASNKGLCGSYNTNVYKATKKIVEQSRLISSSNPKDNPRGITKAICFGKFAEKTARKLGLEIQLSFLEIEKVLHATQISKIENFARNMYLKGEVSKVHAVYTNFIKMGVFEPRAVTLYPVDKNLNEYTDTLNISNNVIQDYKKDKSDKSERNSNNPKQIYTFEPSINSLIEKTIPKIIKIILYSFILESRASENASRSLAMKRANESAGEMLGNLKILFNKIRQDGITQEIAEISAGANAG